MIASGINSMLKRGLRTSLKMMRKQSVKSEISIFSVMLQTSKIQCFSTISPLYKNFVYKFSSNSQSQPIQKLQKQANLAKQQNGPNSMQYIQKLHELSFAYGKANNLQKAIELYKIVVQKFEENIQDKLSPAIGDTLKNLQSLYKRAGKLMEFIPLTIRLVEIRSKESGEESAQVATELNELGVAYYHINNLEEAVNRYKEALKIRQKLFGAQSLQSIQVQNNLATAYYSQGDFTNAKTLFQQNLIFIKQLPNFTQKMLITPMTNLTAILEHQGKHEEALEQYKKIVSILRKVQAKESYFLANIYHSIGIVYMKINNIPKAEEYHSQSLRINQKIYGDKHPTVGENYHNLAVCYESNGRFEKSLEAYNKAIDIKKKTLGSNHPSLAQTYSNMGIVLKFVGKINEAKQKFEEALKIMKQSNPDEGISPLYGEMYLNIGITYLDQGNPQKASQNLTKAEQNFKKFFDSSHPKLSQVYFNKAKVQFIFTKDYAKSRELLDKSISNWQKIAPNYSNLYIQYSMRGSCYFEQRKFKLAVQSYEKSLEILKKAEKVHPEQLLANSALLNYQMGAAYYELKELSKAHETVGKAIEIFEKNFTEAHQTLVELYFIMGNIQKSQGNNVKSQQCYKKASASMQSLMKQSPSHPILLKKYQEIKKCIQN